MEPLTADPETLGRTTKNSTPALVVPPTLTAVSSELHSLPSAKVTWCMRVSLASRCEMTSSWAGSSTNSSCQQPGPNGVARVVSLTHWPRGKSPGFWSALGEML